MSKVRINDLARELEVKSKAILDALPIVGVTEKKTHSSSLEEHEAEKVRAHIRGSSESQTPSARSARPLRGEEEIKTKIDLSHISRPGDVLKAITQQKEAVAPPARLPVPPVAARPVAVPAPPAARPTPPPAAPPVAPSVPAAKAPAPAPAARPQVVAPVVERPVPPPAPTVTSAAAPTAPPVAAPPRPATPVPAAVVAPPAPAAPSVTASAAPQVPVAPPRPAAPAGPPPPPAPRMIVPQTGPRPVYKAPPPRPVAPVAQTGAPAGTMRPAPGRPVPGQPIFQRPRPQVPGGGPPRPLRPGERRPMHPTRTTPAGARPLGVGPGLPPPGPARPGARPGAPARRPGQRYVPRGVKEGPMKGYTPPPRMVVSNEPMPITRNITITEGISVKDLAEKLDIRAKDLISRLLGSWCFRHDQPDARRRTRERNGALLRRRDERDHVRRAGFERH